MSDTLKAIKVLNLLLAAGVESLPIAQHWGQVMQQAQESGAPIPDNEWDYAMNAMNDADKRRAELLNPKA